MFLGITDSKVQVRRCKPQMQEIPMAIECTEIG